MLQNREAGDGRVPQSSPWGQEPSLFLSTGLLIRGGSASPTEQLWTAFPKYSHESHLCQGPEPQRDTPRWGLSSQARGPGFGGLGLVPVCSEPAFSLQVAESPPALGGLLWGRHAGHVAVTSSPARVNQDHQRPGLANCVHWSSTVGQVQLKLLEKILVTDSVLPLRQRISMNKSDTDQ